MENQKRKMKTLTLTIAEPWFSMIRDGKKKEIPFKRIQKMKDLK